ncbi:DUF4153 domain-containing protein [Chryseobacterium sp. HSC-36S06]|uniref:DUF4153 domain-containing protein n=1 Tax=Chryseobacterium sp. HSC-36S06 TaxID=2910970 RepID=UPI00209E0DE9|nr:DUF4153 domain-containing protein [Chryseobacterium sp. HSC-36S06]MCP2038550.1 hypothetical protein [Chryseobacterium sp. HSC-36S06]
MLKKIRDISGKAGENIREYPMVLLMSFLGSVSLICYAHGDFNSNPNFFVFIKFALVSCLGISLMFALKMLSQRIGKQIVLEIAGVLFLVFFYFLLPQEKKYFTERFAFLIVPAFIVSHLLVSFIAFFGKEKELNFWQYNKNLFINIFLTGVFTGVLTGGVELAILAVDQLFSFNFSEQYYLDTFYFLSIFGSSFIFLMFNEKGLLDLEKHGTYPVILKFFTQYILIPLLLIYAVILYLYSAKILINWELPRGWVSYLILAYAVVGILALLLVHPLKHESTASWVRIFSKVFYFTLIPLLVLLFTAIFTRILEYGYTEPRYFVLLLAIWLTLVVFYFIFISKATIKFVPVSLFTIGLFALAFPYLNTFSVAKRSQKTELQNILNQNNLIKNGKIDFSVKVSDTIADEISNKIGFLLKREEKEFVLNYMNPKHQKIITNNIDKGTLYGIEGMVRSAFSNIEKTKSFFGENFELVAENRVRSVKDYDFFARVDNYPQTGGLTVGPDVFTIQSQQKEKILIITLNNNVSWDASKEIQALMAKYSNRTGRLSVPDISLEHDLGNYHLKIMFDNLVRENFGNRTIYFSDAYIFIRSK